MNYYAGFRFSRSDPNLLFSISLSSFCILCKKYITSRFTRRKLIKDKYIYITRQEKINPLTYKYVKKGTFFYKQNTSLIPSNNFFIHRGLSLITCILLCTTLVHFALHHPCAFYFAPPLCILLCTTLVHFEKVNIGTVEKDPNFLSN